MQGSRNRFGVLISLWETDPTSPGRENTPGSGGFTGRLRNSGILGGGRVPAPALRTPNEHKPCRELPPASSHILTPSPTPVLPLRSGFTWGEQQQQERLWGRAEGAAAAAAHPARAGTRAARAPPRIPAPRASPEHPPCCSRRENHPGEVRRASPGATGAARGRHAFRVTFCQRRSRRRELKPG